MKLKRKDVSVVFRGQEIGSKTVRVRPNSTDEAVMIEVVEKRCYRRPKVGFDVEEGEKWLDLGGNVGAFAVYCQIMGASCVSYEPDPTCFSILQKNSAFRCVNSAVSSSKEKSLTFFTSTREKNFYRGTLLEQKRMMKESENKVRNTYAGDIKGPFDGVKMDIEGSEFGIIDNGLIPKCKKLCFEYHTSRDKSMKRLGDRLEKLRKIFKVVHYPPELDHLMALGGEQKSFHDRVIWCMEPRLKKSKKKSSPK